MDNGKSTVTITCNLEEAAIIRAALHHYKAAMQFNYTALHSTEDERQEAGLALYHIDNLLNGSPVTVTGKGLDGASEGAAV